MELMLIESDSRRYICESIKQINNMSNNPKFSQQYYKSIDKFCIQIGKINSVANIEGKGRDDLKSDIFLKCVDILKEK